MNSGTSRAERRRNKRLADKFSNWLKNLSAEQKAFIEVLLKERLQNSMCTFVRCMEMTLRPFLYDNTSSLTECEVTLGLIVDNLENEGTIMNKFSEEGLNYMNEIDKVKDSIIKDYDEGKKNDVKEKVIMEALYSTYSKFSKNAIKNVILEHKREREVTEQDVKEAVDYIFANATKDKHIEKAKPKEKNEKPQFKIVKQSLDVEGIFGTYHIEDGVITIGDNKYTDDKDIKDQFIKRKEELLHTLEVEQNEILALRKEFVR